MGRPPTARGLALAVASVALTTALIYPLAEAVPVVSTGVVYLIAVLLVSSYAGLWPGLLTALLSAAAWNFFHLPPTGEFTIADGENWVALAVFTVAAAVTSTLAGAARRRAEEAERGRREADLTAEMARLLLGGSSDEQPLRTVGQRIAQAYDLSSVSVELSWVDSDARRRALPLIVDGNRIGTVLVPAEADAGVLNALQDRVIPALETLVGAGNRDEGAAAQHRGQDHAPAHDLARPALAADGDHDRGRRARVADPRRRRAARADLRDRDRERATHAARREPARPDEAAGGQRRPAGGLVRDRRARAGGGRLRLSACRRLRRGP